MYTPYSPIEPALGLALSEFYDYEENRTNETLNSDEYEIHAVNIAKGFALSCCAFCAFLGNLLVIVAVASTKRLQTITNLFVVSLALADTAVSVLVMPLSILLEITQRWIFDQIVCDVWISSDVLLCTASILNLCAISVDRYLAITRPLRYAAQRSKRTATLMILCAWCLSFIITAPPILGWRESDRGVQAGKCELTKNPGYIVFSALGSFFLPAAVMITIYIRIFYVAYQREKTFVSAFRTHHTMRRRKTKQSTAEARTGVHETDAAVYRTQISKASCGEPAQTALLKNSPFAYEQQVSSDERIDWQTSEANDANDANDSDDSPTRGNGTSVVSNVLKKFQCSSTSCVHLTKAKRKKNSRARHATRERERNCQEREAPSDTGASTSRSVNYCVQQKLVTFTQRSQLHTTCNAAYDYGPTPQVDSCVDEPELPQIATNPAVVEVTYASSDDGSTLSRISSIGKNSRCTCKALPVTPKRDSDSDTRVTRNDARNDTDSSACNGENATPLRRSDSKRNQLDRSVSARLRARQETLAMREQRKEKAILRSENKTAQTLAVVMGCFVISWSPFFLVYLIKPFCGCHVPEQIEALITWLGYCNSLCNPFIYAFYNKDFLNAFVRIIRQLLCLQKKQPVRNCLRSKKSNASTNSRSE